MTLNSSLITLACGLFLMSACSPSEQPSFVELPAAKSSDSINFDPMQPAWQQNAVIYEVNTRQYTPEGTFAAFMAGGHLERLKDMGVDILWFMPVQPISVAKRKGSLGSYYAITDYTAVNPEFGSMEEFKAIVDKAHSLGMKVVLDWVANHTGWDSKWITEHPDWYVMRNDTISHVYDNNGNPTDWYDIADLNYDSREMRAEMIAAMQFWLREADIDGFRCDVAGFVPDDFWKDARTALDSVKNVWMLAEWGDNPNHFNVCFHANYGWEFHHVMNNIAKGEAKAASIVDYLKKDRETFPAHGYHMQFITNHDENSWNGSEYERMGAGADAFAVLSFTFDGMPLIYTGQEAALEKRLLFFEKDQVEWGDYAKAGFYKTLSTLKHSNKALGNGLYGGPVQPIVTGNDDVFAFYREKDGDKIVVLLNLSASEQQVTLQGNQYAGDYKEVFGQQSSSLGANYATTLPAWGYQVFSTK